jgi:predicted DNA-binding transcriptional regulator
MSKMTVKEYANMCQITRQTVYNQVKKGLLDTVEENGTTYIIADDIEVSSKESNSCQKFVKKLLKRIDKLEKQLNKERKSKDSLILAYVDEMKSLYLPKPKTKKAKKKKK